MRIVLLVIDMQNDFCSPGGRLYVPGAEQDVSRLVALLSARRQEITGLILTRDEHQVMDIAHPVFWKGPDGELPLPFSVITAAEVREGRWCPRICRKKVLTYLQTLEELGEVHMLWPEHCIAGSEGAALVPALMEETGHWARQGRFFRLYTKGSHPLTEQYGIFRARVLFPEAPETGWNKALLRELSDYEMIWIAGEAQSHCVAVSLRQLSVYPELMHKVVVLADAMSPVKGCEQTAMDVFRILTEAGGRVSSTTEWM